MTFLIDYDLINAIQPDEQSQITDGGTESIIQNAFLIAEQEMSSYLSQIYDMTYELRNPVPYDPAHAYAIDDRVLYQPVPNGVTLCYTCIAANTAQPPASNANPPVINGTYWKGDDRNALLISYGLDLCIYTIFRRINPRFESITRRDRADIAREWLKGVNKGNLNVPLKKIQADPLGGRIRFGNGTGLPSNF